MDKVTDTQVLDALLERFGVGDYDETFADEPWWEWKRREVIKIKATRTKRQTEPHELLTAVQYCSAVGIDVRSHIALYAHLADAQQWKRERDRAAATAEFDAAYDAALQHEMTTNPEGRWAGDLIRAAGEGRREAYARWLSR